MACTAVVINRSQLSVGTQLGSTVYTLTGSAVWEDSTLRFEYIDPKTDQEEWKLIILSSPDQAQRLQREIDGLK